MLINFSFNNPTKAKASKVPYSLFLDFRYLNKRYRYPSGLKLKYPHFRQSKNINQLVTPQFENDTGQKRVIVIREFRNIIKRIEDVVDSHEKGHIQEHDLDQAFLSAIKMKPVLESNLLEYFDRFVDEKKMTGKARNTIKVAGSTRKLYEGILEDNPEQAFDVFNLNVEFFDAMRRYCISKGHQISTYNKYLKWTKGMMHWLMKRYPEARINKYFLDESEAETTEKEVVYVFDEEIKTLWETKFKDPAHGSQRDMFIFQYISGQRHNEMEVLRQDLNTIDEENMIWRAPSSKTHSVQNIPITPVMFQIFNKYKKLGRFPLTSLQVRNRVLKVLFAKAGLNRNITIREFKLGDDRPTFTTRPLHELITTHIARASKVTQMSKENFSENMMRQITGHTNSKMLQRYMGNNFEDLKEKFLKSDNDLFGNHPDN